MRKSSVPGRYESVTRIFDTSRLAAKRVAKPEHCLNYVLGKIIKAARLWRYQQNLISIKVGIQTTILTILSLNWDMRYGVSRLYNIKADKRHVYFVISSKPRLLPMLSRSGLAA